MSMFQNIPMHLLRLRFAALSASVVARREDGVALRCRPRTDEDLLLWIHLLLGGLADSPLHGATDPLGVLFAD